MRFMKESYAIGGACAAAFFVESYREHLAAEEDLRQASAGIIAELRNYERRGEPVRGDLPGIDRPMARGGEYVDDLERFNRMAGDLADELEGKSAPPPESAP